MQIDKNADMYVS